MFLKITIYCSLPFRSYKHLQAPTPKLIRYVEKYSFVGGRGVPQVPSDLSFQIRYSSAENLTLVDKIINSRAHVHVLLKIRREKFKKKAGCFLNWRPKSCIVIRVQFQQKSVKLQVKYQLLKARSHQNSPLQTSTTYFFFFFFLGEYCERAD